MVRIYTKSSYKHEGKYRNYLNAVGYICNHAHYPYIIIDWEKERFGIKRLVDIQDIDLFKLLKALEGLRFF